MREPSKVLNVLISYNIRTHLLNDMGAKSPKLDVRTLKVIGANVTFAPFAFGIVSLTANLPMYLRVEDHIHPQQNKCQNTGKDRKIYPKNAKNMVSAALSKLIWC